MHAISNDSIIGVDPMALIDRNVAPVDGDLRVAIVGIGGAGCKIVSKMYDAGCNAGIIAINTDKESLERTSADYRIFICKEVGGKGTFGDIVLGKKCARAHEDDILAVLSRYKYIFIVSGMGGGTGSGSTPVIAELCNRIGINVGAIAMMPFFFESADRYQRASEGVRALRGVCKNVVRLESNRIIENRMVDMSLPLNEILEILDGSVIAALNRIIESVRRYVREDVANHKITLDGNRFDATDGSVVNADGAVGQQ